LELPVEVIDDAKGFARSRGETLSKVMVAALRRHMASPPPIPEMVPLPPEMVPLPPEMVPLPPEMAPGDPTGRAARKPQWAEVVTQLANVTTLLASIGTTNEKVEKPWKIVESMEDTAAMLLQAAKLMRRRHHL